MLFSLKDKKDQGMWGNYIVHSIVQKMVVKWTKVKVHFIILQLCLLQLIVSTEFSMEKYEFTADSSM